MPELVAAQSLVVETADDVARAALRYCAGGPAFSDWWRSPSGRPLYTFDRMAARMDGVEPLG